MPSRITLTVDKGKLSGKNFTFEERTSCIMGRAVDCSPQLPSDDDHLTISRHHCLLDINPPDIRVRDFGSLNGTYVNGKKIGQREEGQAPGKEGNPLFPEHDLKDGDKIQLGDTTFAVGIYVPAQCAECSAEIDEAGRERALHAPGIYLCDACRLKRVIPGGWSDVEEPIQAGPARAKKVCVSCGRDISKEAAHNRQGDYICSHCQADPLRLVNVLLKEVKTGKQELLALQGLAIERELGKGGMGAVYLARKEATGEKVALKVMLPKIAVDQRAKEMFLREAVNTGALHHRNVVELRDSGCADGFFFFTLEYCDGGSVDKYMKAKGGRLSVRRATGIILDVLEGLHYAHHVPIPHVKLKDGKIGAGTGLVHRDLSPHNILLAGSGSTRIAKVADYGLSKAFDTAGLSGLTMTGSVAGKPLFMPRQQVINHKYAKPEVDVWAAAACLYHMLTGNVPRDFPPGKDVWQTVLGTNAVPIRHRDASLPKPLADVIDHALVDNPQIGFKTALELKRALEAAL